MKKIIIITTLLLLLIALIGCSDDNPTASTPRATSVWNASGGYWSTVIDATDHTNYKFFSFEANDTVTISGGIPKLNGVFTTDWDLAFRRNIIVKNGGSTATTGNVQVASLGDVNYDNVTIADTVGLTWTSDFINYFINEWYDYNTQTHALTANRFVYVMKDASGEHYVKFEIDSLYGGAQPPDMGNIIIKYYYQDTTNSLSLAGTPVFDTINVGASHIYYDFSSGSVVSPVDPANSLEWDIDIYNYTIAQNSGPSGIGECSAFPAFTELVDSTDFDGYTAQPANAPLFMDTEGSALSDWYTYDNQKLSSNSYVYLLYNGMNVYKFRIESYYGVSGDKPSATYEFIWNEL